MSSFFKKICFMGALLVLTIGLVAQDAEVRGGESIDFAAMLTGIPGIFMYLLLLLGVVSVVLAIVKLFRLAIKEKFDAQGFFVKLKGYINNEQYDEAIKVCKNFKNKTMGFIFWNGLVAFNEARNLGKNGTELRQILQNSFDEAGMQKIPEVTAGLHWFDLIAQVATLLGLLGTIFGLISAFNALSGVGVAEADKTRLLTKGIGTAMGTTGLGLIVAIPTLLIKGYLQGRAERITDQIDEFSVKTINRINNTIKD